jgi:hypothetical protein
MDGQPGSRIDLYKLGLNLGGYGIGVFIADFIYACWVEGKVAHIDCRYVRRVGGAVLEGLKDRLLDQLQADDVDWYSRKSETRVVILGDDPAVAHRLTEILDGIRGILMDEG